MAVVSMASSALSVPQKLSLTGDTEHSWKLFKQKFELYLLAGGLNKRTDEEKVALLLTLGGDELLELYNSFEFPEAVGTEPDPSKVIKTVLDKFDKHFAPRKNLLADRYKFRNCVQQPGESLDVFITRMKILCKECEYGTRKEDDLRDQLVFGCRDDALRDKFFEEQDLTFAGAVKICVDYEASRKQMAVFRGQGNETVNKMTHKQPKKPNRDTTSEPTSRERGAARPKELRECKFCGQRHVWKKEACPAFGKSCTACGYKNHFAIKCTTKNKQSSSSDRPKSRPKSRKVNSVQEYHEESDQEIQYVMNIASGPSNETSKAIMTTMEVDGKEVRFQVDCGASVNVIPRHLIPNTKLEPCNTVLFMWNSSKIKPLGKCRIVMKNTKNRKRYSVEFVVVGQEFVPILGKRTSEQMNLITVNYENISLVNDNFSNFNDVFSDELGTLPGVVRLTVDPESTPHAIISCRVPISLKNKVRTKLNELEKSKVIAKVDEPTEWVSRMVVGSKKSGDIRICIDPQALNNALKREIHPLPIIDDILPDLAKVRVFSKFD